MLSRTADNLFWISRSMERADTSARLLDVGSRISLIPTAHVSVRSDCPACVIEWVIVSIMDSGHLEVGHGRDEGS